MDVRVVCGLSATMATFCPTSAFRSVDFPAFGRPMRETKPDRNAELLTCHRLTFWFGNTHLLDALPVAGHYFQAHAVAFHELAGLGNAAQPLGNQAADGGG